ncbi:MerR family transcriptional regulator [uncultured Microscilla sp.]|uniref:MerR family transcriptional regulator n=1 Tax=uncultured Microscilla sp. TaxID=432653 RepID=UPI002606DCC9|nr:MerR family transcriptional regulator [uncultured Microscilla sp.]
MVNYSVKQLARLAGVSIRTLHHYDKIGLLVPARKAASGYRYYGKTELLRLQQILFYKELKYPLRQIKELLDAPDFDLYASLEQQKRLLLEEANRVQQLIMTIDKTMVGLKNTEQMITNEELYAGFTPEQKSEYRQEVGERWGEDKLQAVEERLLGLNNKQWTDVKAKGQEIEQLLAELMQANQAVGSLVVQNTIAQHYAHICEFWTPNCEQYRGLGKMYVEDARFTAHYDQYAKGLAAFICEAIGVYCDHGMQVSD